jgi:hypothetical protein
MYATFQNLALLPALDDCHGTDRLVKESRQISPTSVDLSLPEHGEHKMVDKCGKNIVPMFL